MRILIKMTNAIEIQHQKPSESIIFRFGGFLLQIDSTIISPCGSCCSDGSHKFPAKICQGCPCTFCSYMYVDTIFTNRPFTARRDPKTRLAP